MRKKVLIALGIVIVVAALITSSAMAAKPPGEEPSPLDSIWMEVAELWDAINNIELTPGEPGEDGLSIVWHGPYDAGHAYVVNDAVSYEGSSYVCVSDSTGGNAPTDGTYWDLLASKGDTGATGTNGTDGVSITWLGTSGSAPSSPLPNDAYYNSADKKSYIWDGDSWEMLCQDGADTGDGLSLGEWVLLTPNVHDEDGHFYAYWGVAETDGFIVAYTRGVLGYGGDITGAREQNTDPTENYGMTIRVADDIADGELGTITMPVLSGDGWIITMLGSGTNHIAYWIPLGN